MKTNSDNRRSAWISPPAKPLLSSPDGILYDACQGLRVLVPQDHGEVHVKAFDDEVGMCVFDGIVEPGNYVITTLKYCVNWRIELYDPGADKPYFSDIVTPSSLHRRGYSCLALFPSGAIGDCVAHMAGCRAFHRQTGVELIAVTSDATAALFDEPGVRCITKSEAESMIDNGLLKPGMEIRIGLWSSEWPDYSPVDYHQVPLHHNSAYQLGVRPEETPPRVRRIPCGLPDGEYVAISMNGSSPTKMWWRPGGWQEVVDWISGQGLKAVVIDREPSFDNGRGWTQQLPDGVVDFTGDRPLAERAYVISHARAFLGLPSGLTWLAWCVLTPERIAMISGFTAPWSEMPGIHRAVNMHAPCWNCWSSQDYDLGDSANIPAYCPRYYPRRQAEMFVCTKLIRPELVIKELRLALEGERPF